MRDVAAAAGVSPTVVSRVLHDRASTVRVSPATAERVRKKAQELGYRLNVVARNFREQQTMMIGVLHGIGFGMPMFNRGSRYFAALMDGIIEGAFNHNYSVTLCPKLLGQTPEDAMSDGRFDGLVWYSTAPSEETMTMLRNCSVPLVLIHSPASNLDYKFPSVMCDNPMGIGLALDHLISLGHQRIAYVQGSDEGFTESNLRRDIFLSSLRERGIAPDKNSIVNLKWDWNRVAEYFKSNLGHTALIMESDDLAGVFITTAETLGIRIPEDISIVGFDSTDFCLQFRPTITSVRQPLSKLGETAIDLLVDSIASRVYPARQVILPCELDIRGSTGQAAGPKI